jgi:hypothetical protein
MAKTRKTEGAVSYERKKQVTLPTWPWEDSPGEEKVFEILSEIREAAGRQTDDEGEVKVSHIATVKDHATGNTYRLFLSDIFYNCFDMYTSKEYVGKSFAVTRAKAPGKRYFLYDVYEVAVK